jgi:hypothetical protein
MFFLKDPIGAVSQFGEAGARSLDSTDFGELSRAVLVEVKRLPAGGAN